ncbi:MAG: alpha/beta hydrolase [Candidatus Electrothrix sp. AR4]|nr:alpha/beta hydrolase [Candidatus Electrothrix sp. AR4]
MFPFQSGRWAASEKVAVYSLSTRLAAYAFCFVHSKAKFSLKLNQKKISDREGEEMRKSGVLCILNLLILTTVLIFNPVNDASAQSAKKTFVLVHGAFGDQAVWEGPDAENGVAEQLRKRGYRVVMATLPGLGRNQRQADESINLESHVRNVVDILEIDNITDAIVVCHSYSGLLCAAVQDQVPRRISKMVFFDAVVPVSGDSFFSAVGMPSPDWFPDLQTYYRVLGLPVPAENLWCFPNLSADAFALTDPVDLAWLNERQHCQPIHTFDQPVTFNWKSGVRKYFIHATVPWFSYKQFLMFKERAIDMGWNLYSMGASHYAAISNPDEVVKILTLIDNTPYEHWSFN